MTPCRSTRESPPLGRVPDRPFETPFGDYVRITCWPVATAARSLPLSGYRSDSSARSSHAAFKMASSSDAARSWACKSPAAPGSR